MKTIYNMNLTVKKETVTMVTEYGTDASSEKHGKFTSSEEFDLSVPADRKKLLSAMVQGILRSEGYVANAFKTLERELSEVKTEIEDELPFA